MANADRFVPLSVRSAPRLSRKRLIWWSLGRREAVALWLAPWFRGIIEDTSKEQEDAHREAIG